MKTEIKQHTGFTKVKITKNKEIQHTMLLGSRNSWNCMLAMSYFLSVHHALTLRPDKNWTPLFCNICEILTDIDNIW